MKKIAFALSTLSLAFALTACTSNTTKTNQVSPGTRIQSSTGIYNGTTGGTNLNRNGYGTSTYGTPGGAYSYGTNNGMKGGTSTYGTTNGTVGTNLNGARYGTPYYGTTGRPSAYGTMNGTTGGTTTYGTTRNPNGINTAQNQAMGTYKYSIYKPNNSGATTNQFRAYSRSEQPLVGVARVGNFSGATTQALHSANTTSQSVYVDRQMLANALAAVAKQYPTCKGATVVTTDNQAFVGCDTRGLNSVQAKKVVDQIRSATSGVCPRYYKVYASNDQKVIDNMYRASGTLSNKTDGEFEKLLGLTK